MKKFLTTFFFIVVLLGLGFFFGWAQMGVPPDSYGVIRSKSHGLDTRLVRPGEFRWVWYKLIPTNAQTTVLRLSTVSREFSGRNILPSGKIYSLFAGIDGDFSWEINAEFHFNLSPDAIIPLVIANNIGTQEELARCEQDIAGQIEAFILRRMDSIEEFASRIETLFKNGASPALEREILGKFPQITNFSIVVKSAKAPDFALYTQIKELYEEYVAKQREYISSELREKVRERAEIYARFDELELYGVLLSKYPMLLDYLALENSSR